MFVAGNDAEAKATTRELLSQVVRLERDRLTLATSTARATESYLHLWLRAVGRAEEPTVQPAHRSAE